MKKNLFLIVIILTTKVFSQNINMNIGATKSKNYYQEITFEFIKNKIIIPVEIDGKTYKFLLDTGAPNMISKEIHDLIKWTC